VLRTDWIAVSRFLNNVKVLCDSVHAEKALWVWETNIYSSQRGETPEFTSQ